MTISQSEFHNRRRALMALMEENSIAIIPSAEEKIRSRDTHYTFRQDSDFYYLTGFNEPQAVLVLLPGRATGEVVMFCRERNLEKEIWDGFRYGPEGVCAHFGADDAFPIDDVDDILPGLLEGRKRVYYALGQEANFDGRVMGWVNLIRSKVRSGAVPPGEFIDLNHLLHNLRLFKSVEEQAVMSASCELAARAHVRAMEFCKPGLFEYQLEAEILHEFAMGGAPVAAYNTIVGGGENACVLHYISNNCPLVEGDLVLIDAGCEYQGYAADITRTFPVSGRYSPEQRALYDLVLEAQLAAIAVVKPGNHWNQPHEAAVQVLTAGLVRLGLLEGEVETLIEQNAYRPFYMHRTGHWLGMDVHDVGDYKVDGQWRLFEPGMVLTVEPGLYIGKGETSVAKKWRGIGIRIEDDVLVTPEGCRVLTDAVPKKAAAIEALMAAQGSLL
ncbi:MAG TPA: Xaa-Pro aminopeptidase [Cellvibrionaceae bacterium]